MPSALTGNTSGLASATSPGLVGITTQTFAGSKTFQDGLAFTSASLSDVQATILGLKQYLHGTTYNGGNAPTVTCSQSAGYTTTRGVFIPYQMQDGTWRLKFNAVGVFTAATLTNFSVTVNGIATKNISGNYQSVTGWGLAAASPANQAYIASNGNTFVIIFASQSQNGFIISGDIELNSKPTWAY